MYCDASQVLLTKPILSKYFTLQSKQALMICCTVQPSGGAALEGYGRPGSGVAHQAGPCTRQCQQRRGQATAVAAEPPQGGFDSCAGPARHLFPARKLPGAGEPLQNLLTPNGAWRHVPNSLPC